MVGNRKMRYDQDVYGAYIYNSTQGTVLYPINSTDGNFTVESVYKIKFYITDGKLYIAEDIGAGRLIECEARNENSMLKETEHFPGDQY